MRRRSVAVRAALLVAALASLYAACIPFGPARRRSRHPLEGESAPVLVEAYQARCGPLRVAGGRTLRRAPYLQQVGPTSARVLWTSASGLREYLVLEAADTLDAPRRIAAETIGPAPLARDAPTWHRRARIDGLTPREVYCYAIVAADGQRLHGPVAFRTAPAPGEGSVDVVVLGDSGGGGDAQRAVRDQLVRVPADLILHAGDLGYFVATAARLEETVFAMYAPLLRSVPIYPVLGDHDVKADDGQPFLDAFDLPGDERAYSFDYGPIHVAAIDTTRDVTARARWLDADLRAARARWTIVIAHHPPFSSGWHGGREDVRRHVVPVLEQHDVDLFVAGHDHDYERTHPIRGVVYVVTGGGGHSVRPVGAHAWTAASDAVLHFVHLRATRDELVIRAIDATGRVFDVHRLSHREG